MSLRPSALLPLLALLLVACNGTPRAGTTPRRVALVVGNGGYSSAGQLRNPSSDATAVAEAFERLGVRTTLVLDADRREFHRQLTAFRDRSRGADGAIFYYAGHGLQIDDRNYLVPVDFDVATSARNLGSRLVSLDQVLATMAQSARTNIVILDACRNNPFKADIRSLAAKGRSVSLDGSRAVVVVGDGLAKMKSKVGTLIAFATDPGAVASDGKGEHSPFTTGLLESVEQPGLEINQILNLTRRRVQELTGGKQLPWTSSALVAKFFFRARQVAAPPPP